MKPILLSVALVAGYASTCWSQDDAQSSPSDQTSNSVSPISPGGEQLANEPVAEPAVSVSEPFAHVVSEPTMNEGMQIQLVSPKLNCAGCCNSCVSTPFPTPVLWRQPTNCELRQCNPLHSWSQLRPTGNFVACSEGFDCTTVPNAADVCRFNTPNCRPCGTVGCRILVQRRIVGFRVRRGCCW